jgi:uncharacterized protein with HEPN domain
MSPSAREYLQHILDEAAYLLSCADGLDKETFFQDPTLKRAFVRSIEIIGEATKQVSESVRRRAPQIEWRAIASMRDRLIHGYFGVDYDIVWDVVTNKVPTLEREVQRLLDEEPA